MMNPGLVQHMQFSSMNKILSNITLSSIRSAVPVKQLHSCGRIRVFVVKWTKESLRPTALLLYSDDLIDIVNEWVMAFSRPRSIQIVGREGHGPMRDVSINATHSFTWILHRTMGLFRKMRSHFHKRIWLSICAVENLSTENFQSDWIKSSVGEFELKIVSHHRIERGAIGEKRILTAYSIHLPARHFHSNALHMHAALKIRWVRSFIRGFKYTATVNINDDVIIFFSRMPEDQRNSWVLSSCGCGRRCDRDGLARHSASNALAILMEMYFLARIHRTGLRCENH